MSTLALRGSGRAASGSGLVCLAARSCLQPHRQLPPHAPGSASSVPCAASSSAYAAPLCPVHNAHWLARLPGPSTWAAQYSSSSTTAFSKSDIAGHKAKRRRTSIGDQDRPSTRKSSESPAAGTANSFQPPDRGSVMPDQERAPRTLEQRKARKEAILVLNRIMRFRTRRMKKIPVEEVIKLFQEQFPFPPNGYKGLHYGPEIWARLLKLAYVEQHSPALRFIANQALKWCRLPVAETFDGPSDAFAIAPNLQKNGSFRLPQSTADLELLIRNLIQADDLRILKTEQRKEEASKVLGVSENRISLRDIKKRSPELYARIDKIDISKTKDEDLIPAQRVAWSAQLKSLSRNPQEQGDLQQHKPRTPAVEAMNLQDVQESRVSRLFRAVNHRRHVEEPARKAGLLQAKRVRKQQRRKAVQQKASYHTGSRMEEDDAAWKATEQAISSAKVQASTVEWHQTLDRFAEWARHAQESQPESILAIIDLLKKWDEAADCHGNLPNVGPVRTQGTGANQLTVLSPPQQYEATGSLPERPPTYLLLAALRQLAASQSPRAALGLARWYLATLLRDAKAGRFDPRITFSRHPACDEVSEPHAHERDRNNSHKHPSQPSLSLFLRRRGRTYSVSSPLVPPRGHELLNAVLRAHLRANHGLKEMLASMRALCGVRVGRFVRTWEAERRYEVVRLRRANAKVAKKGHALRDMRFGMQREDAALSQLKWDLNLSQDGSQEHRTDVELPFLSTKLAPKAVLNPKEARAQAHRRIDIEERVAQATSILCYPDEESFLILLLAIKKHESALADGIALINTALTIWGPPAIQPVSVPTNLNPRCLLPNRYIFQVIRNQRMQIMKDDAPPKGSIHSDFVVPLDPYLRITTATVRSLLRWALWTRREGNAVRLLDAAEGWVRHSREWDAGLRGLPVMAFHPGLHAPGEEEAKAWIQRHKHLGFSLHKQPAPVQWRSVTYSPLTVTAATTTTTTTTTTAAAAAAPAVADEGTHANAGSFMSEIQSEPRVNPHADPVTWMSVDGGSGWLGPRTKSYERAAWLRVLLRARKQSRSHRSGRSGLRAGPAVDGAAQWEGSEKPEKAMAKKEEPESTTADERVQMDTSAEVTPAPEPGCDNAESDHEDIDNDDEEGDGPCLLRAGPPAAKTGSGIEGRGNSWLDGVQLGVLMGEDDRSVHRHLFGQYESLYLPLANPLRRPANIVTERPQGKKRFTGQYRPRDSSAGSGSDDDGEADDAKERSRMLGPVPRRLMWYRKPAYPVQAARMRQQLAEADALTRRVVSKDSGPSEGSVEVEADAAEAEAEPQRATAVGSG